MALLLRRCGPLRARLGLLRPRCSSSAPAAAPGFFELRQTELQPNKVEDFNDLLKASPLAGKSPLGAWTTDIGESAARVYHLYDWADYDERDERQAAFGRSPDFRDVRHRWGLCVARDSSSIFAEATPMLTAVGLPGMLGYAAQAKAPKGHTGARRVAGVNPAVYELRTYQLRLGYSTVPRFLELYKAGLEDKLAADSTGQSELVSLLHSEAGAAPLNTVVELWRHESMQGSQVSRAASRGAPAWRKAVGDIAELASTFTTQFLRPVEGSTLR